MSLTVCAEGMTQDRFTGEFERFVAFSARWTDSLAAGSEELPLADPATDEDGERNNPDGNIGVHLRV